MERFILIFVSREPLQQEGVSLFLLPLQLFWNQDPCQVFWCMTQSFTQITDHTLCQVNVPALPKDWLTERAHLIIFTLTCKERHLSWALSELGPYLIFLALIHPGILLKKNIWFVFMCKHFLHRASCNVSRDYKWHLPCFPENKKWWPLPIPTAGVVLQQIFHHSNVVGQSERCFLETLSGDCLTDSESMVCLCHSSPR